MFRPNARTDQVVLGDRHVHETLRRLSQEFSLPDLIKSMLPLSLQGHGVPPPPPELLPMFEGKGSLEETVERLKRRETVRRIRVSSAILNTNSRALDMGNWLLLLLSIVC